MITPPPEPDVPRAIFIAPPVPLALSELLATYSSVLNLADEFPSLLTIRVGDGRLTRRLRVPRVRLFLQFFLAHHMRSRAAVLQRRFHAEAAAGRDRDGELGALEHFEKSIPPVPLRRVVIWFAASVVLTAVLIANLARTIAPDPLSKASTALQGSLAGVINVDPNGLVEAAGKFDAASGVAACLAITLSLYLVGALPITSFRLKRIVMNLSPTSVGAVESTTVIYYTDRASGVYRDESAAFYSLGVPPRRELPLDLIAQAVLMFFPLVLGVALATANFESLTTQPLIDLQALGLRTVLWVCFVTPQIRLGQLWGAWRARRAHAIGAQRPHRFNREELALPSRRFAAFLIDAALIAMLSAALVALSLAVLGDRPLSSGGLGQSALAWFVAVPVSILVMAVPSMLREGPHSGQTLGKQIVGIRVVSSQGGRVPLGSAVIREVVLKSLLLGGPSAALLFIPALIDGVWLIMDPEHRSIHDQTVRTRVVWVSDAAL